MTGVVLVAIVLVGALVVWRMNVGDRRASREFQKELPSVVARDMARALEGALADPVYRQSAEWEERARTLVRRHYGEED